MLKRVALLAIATLCPVATAFAADLPRRNRGPDLFSPAPLITWTGLYAGAQAGYAWGNDQTNIDVSGFPFTFSGPDHDASGAVGGVHAGYNYQTGLAVFGIEGDIELAGINGKSQLTGTGAFSGYNITSSLDVAFQGSVRGRVGFALLERMMLYGTAGLAFATIENKYTATLPPGNIFGAPAGTSTAKFDDVKLGWTVGAGVEYAIMSNWTARFEYRYTNYSAYKNATALLGPAASSEQDPDFHTLRIGASYRF
jgi:outer membrane immunogenic protein